MKVKIALWGIGRHAIKRVLPAIKKAYLVDLHAVCTRNKKIGNEQAKINKCKYYSSSSEMLLDKEIEAIYLCTPSGLHFHHGKEILKSGKHLWSEKPITTSYTHTKKLIKLASENRLFIGECFMYLYSDQFIQLKKLVDKKQLGSLRTLLTRFSIPKLNNPGFRNTMELGGGSLMDLGSYLFSLTSRLFEGDFKISLAEYSKDKNMIDQSGYCFLKYKTGQKAFLEWAYDSCFINQAELWFDRGSIFANRIYSKSGDGSVESLIIRSNNGEIKKIKLKQEDCYVKMLNIFSSLTKQYFTPDFKFIKLNSFMLSCFKNHVKM